MSEMLEKKEKTLKSSGEKVFSKFSEMESSFAILKNEMFALSPEELAKFQALKNAKPANSENLSPTQIKLIKIIKEAKDKDFIQALSNTINGFVLVRKNAEKMKDEKKN